MSVQPLLWGLIVGIAIVIGRKLLGVNLGGGPRALVDKLGEEWRAADARRLTAWARGIERLERRNRGEPARAVPTPDEWALRAAHHERRAAALRLELSRVRAAAAQRVRFPRSRTSPRKSDRP